MEDYNQLVKINQEIRDAEFHHDKSYFKNKLSDDLIFRRASGKFVNKQLYMDELPLTKYDILDAGPTEIIPIDERSAYTILNIAAKGKRPDGAEFEGNFRNTRFFRKKGTEWELYAWCNENSVNQEKQIESSVSLGDENKFTGTVLLQTLHIHANKKWYQVFFHPASRTNWHIHTGVQELFITSGDAIVVMKTGDNVRVQIIKQGDNISIPPGILHWHGAADKNFMIHIACNNNNIDSQEFTYWFDKVTDEEFNRQ
jgi:quercetin dioxygenase-like cupin family protein